MSLEGAVEAAVGAGGLLAGGGEEEAAATGFSVVAVSLGAPAAPRDG